MSKHNFSLSKDIEYITLDKLLKLMRMVGSGGEAHAVIQEGMVEVNGAIELQKHKKLRIGDTVAFNGQEISIEE